MAKGNILHQEEIFEKRALALRTIGVMLFIEASITVVWVWMGLRSGSEMWLWLTLGCGFGGLLLFGIAEHQHRRAIQMVALRRESIREPLIGNETQEAA